MNAINSIEAFILQTGSMGKRFVINSMGCSTVCITEIHQNILLLTCFGNLTRVDETAATIEALE